MMRFAVLVIVMGVALVGCGRQEYPADKVTKVADNDPRMNAAMEKARSTADQFIAALESPQPGQTGFTVKVGITDGPDTEHMWLAPVSYDGKRFHGQVSNEAVTVKNVSMGQPVVVSPSKISDWMYLDHGKVVGGYTLRVLRETLSPEERAKFDKEVRFLFDE